MNTAPPPLRVSEPVSMPLAVLFMNVTLIILTPLGLRAPCPLRDRYIAPPSLSDTEFLNIQLLTV